MVDTEKMTKLYESFTLSVRKGLGGMSFKYIPSSDVIDRMNRVFMGCWSTQVLSQEVIEDTVVLRVMVSAYDKDTERIFSHDGYGSSSLARYTSGPNKDKLIDAGNSYKSAEAMAIRHACTRFGVGLYLEGEGYEPAETTEAPTPPTDSLPAPPDVPEQRVYKETGDVLPTVPPMTEASEAEFKLPPMPTAPPVEEKPADSGPTLPPGFGLPPIQQTDQEDPMPKFPTSGDPVLSLKTKETTSKAFDTANTNSAVTITEVTDVQNAAIDGLLTLKDVDYEALVKYGFEKAGWDTDNTPSRNELTYKQAVPVIKYGNKKFRNNN